MSEYLFTGINSNQIVLPPFYTNNYAKLLAKIALPVHNTGLSQINKYFNHC